MTGDFFSFIGTSNVMKINRNTYDYRSVRNETVKKHNKLMINVCNNIAMVGRNFLCRSGRKPVGDL